jgi:hypothetical protein
MSKIYEVTTYQTICGRLWVEADSAAEAATLIENGYGTYEEDSHQYEQLEYHITDMYEEETSEAVYEYDDHKAFEKAYADGRIFYKKQGQLNLGDAPNTYSGWHSDAHDFALRYAREETGMGLAELADIGC